MSYSSGIFVQGQAAGTSIIDRNGNINAVTLTVTGASTMSTYSSSIGACTQRFVLGASAVTYTFPAIISSFQGLALDTGATNYIFSNVSNLSNVSMATLGTGTATGLTNITVTNFTSLYLRQPAFSGFTVTNRWSLQTEGPVYINNATASSSSTTGALVVDGGAGIAGNLFVGGTINGTILTTTVTTATGSAAAPTHTFTGVTNTGMYYNTGSTSLSFSNAGADRLVIAAGGNVTVSTGRLLIPSLGAAATPAIGIGVLGNDGFYSSAAGSVNIATNGVLRVTVSTATVTSTLPLQTPAGSVTACSLQMAAANDGFYRIAAGNPAVSAGGTNVMNWTNARVAVVVVGSAATPSLIFSTDTTSGFYRPAANQIGLTISGAQVLGVSATGLNIVSGNLTIPAASNQIVLRTTNTVTINAVTSAASRIYSIADAGVNANFIMSDFTGGQTIAGGLTSTGTTTFSGAIAATGANAINFSGSSGTFSTSTGAVTLGPGALTMSGQSTFTAAGSTSATSATIYVNPASTALTGISNYFFTYLNTPTTTGTSTGIAATLTIAGSPSNVGGTSLSLYVITGRASFGDTTASTSTTSGAVVISGGLGVAGAIFAGGALSATTGTFTAASNQLVLGTTNTLTLTTTQAAARVYTIPDAGANTSFILAASTGGQTIAGGLTSSGVLSIGAGITATGGNVNFSGSNGTFSTSTGAVTIGSGTVSVTGATTFSSSVSATGTGNIDFSGSSGTFLTPTGNITLGTGAITATGRATFAAAGSTAAASATLYVNPASTALTGNNNYFFTALAAPTTTGTTTGIAATATILGAPAGATTPYALYVISGRSYFADTTAAASTSTGAVVVQGGVGIGGNLYVGGTIFGTFNGTISTTSITLSATTNQIVLGTGQTITLNAPTPVASRTYTIPDVGGTASFIMNSSTGGQTIAGGLTSSGTLSIGAGITATGGNVNFSGSSGTFNTPTGSNTYNGLKYNAVPTALTANTTLTTAAGGTSFIALNGTTAFTVTLPTTSGNGGLEYFFINIGSAVVTIQVSNTTTESFDGTVTTLTLAQYDRARIVCYTGIWFTF